MDLHIFTTENGYLGDDFYSQIAIRITKRVSFDVAYHVGLNLEAIYPIQNTVEQEGHWRVARLVT